MAKSEVRTPKGMRDYLPADMIKRRYVFDTVRAVFESFGFEPIETPVLELRSTLMGANYGEDAEKLIYYAQHPGGKEELALRYDLTVPLARFVAEHENDLKLPFRRYHLAPVWRGERPQKGRYREFYQCDADIVGIRGTSADAEVMSVVYTALTKLGFNDFTIKMNNRKLLTGLGIYAGVPEEKRAGLYRIVDKTDKVGLDGVADLLAKEELAPDTIKHLLDILHLDGSGSYDERLLMLAKLRELFDGVEEAQEGIVELQALTEAAAYMGIPVENNAIDFTMVRGLGYYTGPIFETVITRPDNLGSVQGGGRYDQLIGRFRGQSLPTTGISLGIERLVDLMDMLNLYPSSVTGTVVQALVAVFSDALQNEALRLSMELRAAGINTETYMDTRKSIGNQLGYADTKGIQVVIIAGPDEIAQNIVRIKHLASGEEIMVARGELAAKVSQLLV